MATDRAIVLITGANQGLGYYAAAHMSMTDKYHILLGSRAMKKAADAIEKMKSDEDVAANAANVSPIEIDITSDASIAAAVRAVEQQYGRLDILINNAGISRAAGVHSDVEPNADGSGPSPREQYRQIYDTNVFGTAMTIDAFLPLLRRSTIPGGRRIACTGSSTGLLDASLHGQAGMNAKAFRLYRSSKSALHMVVVSYARELEDDGFVVAAACPGYCSTNLNLHKGAKHPRDGAKAIVRAAEAPKEECHGRLINETSVIPY